MRVRLSNVTLIVAGLEGDAQSLDGAAMPTSGRVRLSNLLFVEGGFEADAEPVGAAPPPPPPLRDGYNSDVHVAADMFFQSMARHELDPIAVQGHGQVIVDALNADYPGLNAYADPRSDAVMWPGFGSLDVTVDSGKGGWSFRPDGVSRYEPDPRKR